MEQLHFRFMTKLDFDSEVKDHHFALKCIPQSNARQRVENCRVEIIPDAEVFYGTDAHGNKTISGSILTPHDSFEFIVDGTVTTGIDIFEAFEPDEVKNAYYKYPTPYTTAGPKLAEYFDSLGLTKDMSTYDKVTAVMRAVNRDFTYEKNVTDINTTAEEAMALRKGVCQDFTHVMIALCRMADIPARYAVGIMKGEGESHAWVEAWCRGYWYGFDPTNNWLVDANYIKISAGRDYSDCIVNRGKFIGNAAQSKTVTAMVLD